MSSKQLGYSVIGYQGYWAQNIIKSLDSLGFRIDRKYDLNDINSLETLEGMLYSDKTDIILVCSPPSTHFEIGMKVVEAGKNLWLEKPMSLSCKEADKILAKAKEKRVIVNVDLTWCYDSHFRFIRDHYAMDTFGKLLSASFIWAANGKVQFCGVGLDLLPHPFSLAQKLFGYPDFISAHSTDIDKLDHEMNCLLVYKRKFNVEVKVSWLSPRKVRKISLVTDRGILETEFTGTVEFTKLNGEREIYRIPHVKSPLELQLLHLDQCLKENLTKGHAGELADTMTSGNLGYFVLKMIEKAKESCGRYGDGVEFR